MKMKNVKKAKRSLATRPHHDDMLSKGGKEADRHQTWNFLMTTKNTYVFMVN